MPRTPEEQTQWEMQAQGCLTKDLLESVKDDVEFSGSFMVIMSMLSDAQELIAMGEGERARQEINKAKRILMETVDGKMVFKQPR